MFRVDESKLNGKIVERGTTKEAIASEIGIDRCTFYRRIKSNKLLISDMHKICNILSLSSSEAIDIFLAQ
jgi:DNA invertase Pin-like site-specific DNA recombinase